MDRPRLISDLFIYDVVTLREIGIKELKGSLSEVLRAVEAGESVRVTNHGRPVAELTPPRAGSADERLWQLAAQGRVTPPRREGRLSHYEPVEWPAGEPLPSATILAGREESGAWGKG